MLEFDAVRALRYRAPFQYGKPELRTGMTIRIVRTCGRNRSRRLLIPILRLAMLTK